MPEQTAGHASPRTQEALLALETRSGSYLTRSEAYKSAVAALEDGEQPSDTTIKKLLQILAHDLKHDTKHASAILKLLEKVLANIKRGDYAVFTELTPTMVAIMNVLFKTAPLFNVQAIQTLCLEVFLSYPDKAFATLGTAHAAEVISLFREYLEGSQVEETCKIMVIDALHKMLKSLPADERREFVKEGLACWFSCLIPIIYNNSSLRTKVLDVTDALLPDLQSIDYADNPQWHVLFKQLSSPDRCPLMLKSMLSKGESDWDRAWCLFVKLLSLNLHKSSPLINAYLLVLENAFKMPIAVRCKAFQCWVVFIENFALNMDTFFSYRKMKLMLTPLKVNNAKEETCAAAKFQTWWVLIHLSQPKMDQVLDQLFVPFLEFCFGKANVGNENQPQIVPGLTFPNVQCLAVDGIAEMMGHCECNGCISEDFRRLSEPLMTSEILSSHLSHWMHALKEATVLVSKMKSKCIQKITCCWKSVLRHAAGLDDFNKKAIVLKEVLKIVSELVEMCQNDVDLCYLMFDVVMLCLFDKNAGILNLTDNTNTKSSSMHLLTLVLCPAFRQFYSLNCDTAASKLKTFTDVAVSRGLCKWFLQELPTHERSLVWWISLTNSIVDLKCAISEDISRDLLIWPITKMEYFTDIKSAVYKWSELYAFLTLGFPANSSLHLDIQNILMLHYKSNVVANMLAVQILPLTIKSVLKIDSAKVSSMEKELCVLAELTEAECGDEKNIILTAKCLSSVIHSLSIRNEAGVAEYALTAANNVIKYLLARQPKEQDNQQNEDTILKLMKSIQKLFSNDSYVKLTIQMVESLSDCAKFSKSSVREVARTIIATILCKSNKTETLLLSTLKKALSKSQKIDNVTEKPKEDETVGLDKVKDNVTAMITPASVKDIEGNLLQKNFSTPKSKPTSKTPKNNCKIVKKVVESNEEFVVVKSNWKFNPSKLTEHQKEMLKKKREDIPALYQDLSQSQDEMQIKTWRMPGYKSDSQDVSTTVSTSIDKDDSTNTVVTNILKEIPNPELCPNIMKVITTEDEKDSQVDTELMKDNPELVGVAMVPTTESTLPKTTPLKPLRMSLKDRISKNMMSLMGKKNEKDQSSVPTSPSNVTNEQTPERTKIPAHNANFSAPSKMDCDRPSRMKRKPKKFDSNFEVPQLIKRRRNSLDFAHFKPNDILVNKEEQPKMSVVQVELSLTDADETVCLQQEIEDIAMKLDKSDPSAKILFSGETPPSTNSFLCLKEVNSVETIINESERPLEKLSTIKDGDLIKKNDLINDTKATSSIEIMPENGHITPRVSLNKDITNNHKNSKTPIKPKSNEFLDTKSSTKKKNRLEVQLAIDMVEGHPLLTPKEEKRSTRMSRLISDLTPGRRNSTERAKQKCRLTSELTTSVKDAKKHNKENNASNRKENEDAAVSNNDNIILICDSPVKCSSSSSTCTNLGKDVISQTKCDEKEFDLTVASTNAHPITISDSEEVSEPQSSSSSMELANSQDFIESSQESTMSTIPTISVRSSRRSVQRIGTPKVSKKTTESDNTSECNSDPGFIGISNTKILEDVCKEPNLTINKFEDEMKQRNQNCDAITMDEHSNIVDNELEANRTMSPSDNTIAEMDTQPIATVHLCDDDVIFIDKCDANLQIITVDTESIKADSESVAEASTEPLDTENINRTCFDEVSPIKTVVDVHAELPDSVPETQAETTCKLAVNFDCQKESCEEADDDNVSVNTTLSSPFKDTEERNKEFLNNTLDISPIKVTKRIPSPPCSSENSSDFVVVKLSPVKINGEPVNICDSPEIFTNEKVSPDKKSEDITNDRISPDKKALVSNDYLSPDKIVEIFSNEKISPNKRDQSPPRLATANDSGSPGSLSLKKNRPQVRQTGRGAQMLGMCIPDKLDSMINCDKVADTQETKRNALVVTPARRNLRMYYAGKGDKESQGGNLVVDNFLSFTKEVPSATSSPSGPILKRKLADIADETTLSPTSKNTDMYYIMSATLSPSGPILKRKLAVIADKTTLSPTSKRKRVSFHDPPVSTTVSVHKYIEGYILRSPQHTHKKERQLRSLTPKSLIQKLENVYKMDITPCKTVAVTNSTEHDSPLEAMQPEIIEQSPKVTSKNDTEATMTEETQMSLLDETPLAQIIDHDQLNNTDPIYPDLVDCPDSIASIASELSSESMKDLLVKELEDTIQTVGDLAKLTELEVNRLCVKAPKIETVKKVLSAYTRRPLKEVVLKPIDITMDAEIQTEFEEDYLWATLKDRSSREVIEACLEKKNDFVEEFSNSMSEEAKQKMTQALPTSVIGQILCDRLTDKDETESLFTMVAQTHPEQFMEQTFKQFGAESVGDRLGLHNIEEYLLTKLTPGELVKFCSKILQKKIPSD